MLSGTLAPRTIYGTRHDYVYYPDSWTDTDTGTYYEKGYYDENGERYDDVSFARNGKYENVLCHCDYCGRDTLLNLDATDALTDLKCPGCTAPLTIKSALDEAVATGGAYSPSRYAQAQTRPRKKNRKWPWILAAFLFLFGLGRYEIAKEEVNPPQYNQTQQIQQIENYYVSDEDTILLVRSGPGTYVYSDSGDADKTLVWDEAQDSYYDKDTDCWLWYNEDLDPAVWQYWYEGISSDYGDYGWMEHYSDGWYIEASPGNWIPLPDSYDTGDLWYIED